MTQIKNKKVILTILVVLAGLFSILITSVYPTSHSKFFDKNDNALSYTTQLYQLRNFDTLKFSTNSLTNYKRLVLDFSLPRNSLAKANEKDQYIIEVPSTCKVVGLTEISSTNGLKRFSTTFSGDETTKKLSISCNLSVDPTGIKKINFDVNIYEKVENETEFLYLKDNYIENNHYDNYPIPDITYTEYDLTMPVDAFKKKRLFESWVEEYVESYVNRTYKDLAEVERAELIQEFQGFALDYIETIYQTDSDFIKIPNNPLKGLTVSYDAKLETYHYHLDENFLGYAKTIIWDDPYSMYFSTSNVDELNEAFAYYLKSAYPKEQDQKDIINYVNHYSNNKGIAYLVLPNADGSYNAISGFDYFYDDDKQLYLDECLDDYVYAFVNGELRVNNFFDEDMRIEDIKVNFRNLYQDKISEDVYNSLLSDNSEILESLLNVDKDEFHDYNMIYDQDLNQYLYIEIYSLVDDDYNFAKINFIIAPNNVTLSLEGNNGDVKAVVKDMTVADLNAFINQLVLPAGIVVSDSSNAGEVSFSIQNASDKEIQEILVQLSNYMEKLETSQEAIVKEKDIIESSSEESIKE